MQYDFTSNPIPATDSAPIVRVIPRADGNLMVGFLFGSTENGPFTIIHDPVTVARCRAAMRQADEAKAKRMAKAKAPLAHNPFRGLQLK